MTYSLEYDWVDCPACGGAGEVWWRDDFGQLVDDVCWECMGQGGEECVVDAWPAADCDQVERIVASHMKGNQ